MFSLVLLLTACVGDVSIADRRIDTALPCDCPAEDPPPDDTEAGGWADDTIDGTATRPAERDDFECGVLPLHSTAADCAAWDTDGDGYLPVLEACLCATWEYQPEPCASE